MQTFNSSTKEADLCDMGLVCSTARLLVGQDYVEILIQGRETGRDIETETQRGGGGGRGRRERGKKREERRRERMLINDSHLTITTFLHLPQNSPLQRKAYMF